MDQPIENQAESQRRVPPNLERDKVAVSALELLDEVGLEGLTLRRLADKLGVKAAALYWHFKNKQDLIDQVAAKILDGDYGESIPDDADWRVVLRVMAHHSRKAFIRYRDGALVVVNADLLKVSYAGREYIVGHLLREGFSPDDIMSSMFLVGRYTLGCAIEEQSDSHSEEGQSRISKIYTTKESVEKYPHMAQVIGGLTDARISTAEGRFEAGLDFILAGIAQKVTEKTA